jgi:hypothetical protein
MSTNQVRSLPHEFPSEMLLPSEHSIFKRRSNLVPRLQRSEETCHKFHMDVGNSRAQKIHVCISVWSTVTADAS